MEMTDEQHATNTTNCAADINQELTNGISQQDHVIITTPKKWRQDHVVMIFGLVTSVILSVAIFAAGWCRDWDAWSGHYHNDSMTSPERFLPEPTHPDPYPDIRGRTDRPGPSAMWYYWKLKPDDVTLWSRALVWGCYSLHQLSIWVLVYLAQLESVTSGRSKTGTNLNKYNYLAFGVNTFFQAVHLLQTHATYDALAQDTSIASSQCSVIMLLMIICMLQYTERGLFCGWPVAGHHTGLVSRMFTLGLTPTQLVRRYHGYAFSWAVIYTFWYHPMENTMGHVMGFVYAFLLMLQGSLMMTQAHRNPYWRVLLEVWVFIHGGYMVYQTSKPGNLLGGLWLMVVFGFLMLFAFTQVYLLPFWAGRSRWLKAMPPLVWTAMVIATYSVVPDKKGRYFVRMGESMRIPVIYYAGIFALNAFMAFCVAIDRQLTKTQGKLTLAHRAYYLLGTSLIFIVFIFVSIYVEVTSVPIGILMSMAILYPFFSLGSGLAFVLMNHAFPFKLINNNTNERRKVKAQ